MPTAHSSAEGVRLRHRQRGEASDLTLPGVAMGTPAYMSPEQARGQTKFVGPGADVYALGVILYECVTGRVPFDGGDSVELLQRVARDDPPRSAHARAAHARRPRTHLPEVSPEVAPRAVPRPPRRWPTTRARFLAGDPASVRPPKPTGEGREVGPQVPASAPLYGAHALAITLGVIAGGAISL